jgi:hypothetical protein
VPVPRAVDVDDTKRIGKADVCDPVAVGGPGRAQVAITRTRVRPCEVADATPVSVHDMQALQPRERGHVAPDERDPGPVRGPHRLLVANTCVRILGRAQKLYNRYSRSTEAAEAEAMDVMLRLAAERLDL